MSKPLHELKLELKNSNCTDCEKKTMTRLLNEVIAEYEAEEELAFEMVNYKIPEDAYIGLPSTPGALTPVKKTGAELIQHAESRTFECPADLYTKEELETFQQALESPEETEEWKKGEEVKSTFVEASEKLVGEAAKRMAFPKVEAEEEEYGYKIPTTKELVGVD